MGCGPDYCNDYPCHMCREEGQRMDGMLISQQQIDKARQAHQAYIAWTYLHPNATATQKLAAEYDCAREVGLSSEGKVYYSVMVNESNRPSVSGRGGDMR